MKQRHRKSESDKIQDYYKKAKSLSEGLSKDDMEREYLKRKIFDYFLR